MMTEIASTLFIALVVLGFLKEFSGDRTLTNRDKCVVLFQTMVVCAIIGVSLYWVYTVASALFK
jgi:hypothetical protein